jgi:hypothetical protein
MCCAFLWQTVQFPVMALPEPKWQTVQCLFLQPAVWERGAVSLWHRMQ